MVTKTGAAMVTVKFHEYDDAAGIIPAFYKDPVMRTLRFTVVAVTQKPVAL